MGKIGPTFSHLLTVKAPPPYGQPDRKKAFFFLKTSLRDRRANAVQLLINVDLSCTRRLMS